MPWMFVDYLVLMATELSDSLRSSKNKQTVPVKFADVLWSADSGYKRESHLRPYEPSVAGWINEYQPAADAQQYTADWTVCYGKRQQLFKTAFKLIVLCAWISSCVTVYTLFHFKSWKIS